ncbi:hypothetical protein V1509DRAFT_640072 [Lipomyces kononenkoae]
MSGPARINSQSSDRWLTEEFEYREKVLEFKQLHGPHSGENLAAAVEVIQGPMRLESDTLNRRSDSVRGSMATHRATERRHNLLNSD